jgi:hypothetical protein
VRSVAAAEASFAAIRERMRLGIAMTAMRVLIAFLYTRTNSVLRAQLMHASSTSAVGGAEPAG